MGSIYLSSERPRLQRARESDLLAALAVELSEENHFLDLKREVAAGRLRTRRRPATSSSSLLMSPTAADSVSHRPQRIGPSGATAIKTRIQSLFTRSVMPLLNALRSVHSGRPGFTVILTAALVVSVPTAIQVTLTQRFCQRGLALAQY